jgi:hypothetical protein
MRAILLSERLAFIELALPAGIIVLRASVLGRPVAQPFRGLLHAVPIVGVLALVVFFGGSEYFRSWRYYQHDFDSFAEFTLWRIGGYYTTAHNNGALALACDQPRPLPYATLRALWEFPGIEDSPLAYERLTRVRPDLVHTRTLELHGTPELNSDGGLFQPALDFGLAGSLVFWCGCGFAAGRLYRGFLAGSFAGIVIYPLVLLSILEAPRLLYVSNQRAFPGWAALVVAVWLVHRAIRAEPQPTSAQPAAQWNCT